MTAPRHLRRLAILLIALALLTAAAPAHGQQSRLPRHYRAIPFEDWIWASRAGGPRPTAGQQEAITHSLERVRAQLGVPRGKRLPLIIYTSDRGPFEAVVTELGAEPPGRGVLALAFPGRGVLVLDGSRLNAARTGGFQTVTHELVHVVVGEVSPTVPRWYHEGLAQWLSGQLIEVRAESEVAARAARGHLISFAELSRFLPRQHGRTTLLYVQSHMFVRDLDVAHGSDVHRRILSAMAQGQSFDDAFAAATGSTLAEEETRWLRRQAARHSWWSWYIQYVGLFPTLALLVILGFFIQRSSRRRRLERLAAEERALYGPDA